MAYAVSVTTSTSSASITINGTGGTAGETVYVFRRDSSGMQLVRDSYDGLVWPDVDPLSVVDYEARQGQSTDYVLTDVNGTQLASVVGVVVPSWGTWLKSPTQPERNVRVYLSELMATRYSARRERIAIEDSDVDVVLSSLRGPAEGTLSVSTLNADSTRALVELLRDGSTVMLDTSARFDVPYRYVSVGDVTVARPFTVDDELALDAAARTFVLSELVEVEPPIGTTAQLPGWVYESIAALYDAYVALPASYATYDELARGA